MVKHSGGPHVNNISKATTILGVIALSVIAGCNQAKSPDRVQSDVTRAQESGAKDVARAEAQEAKTDAKQDDRVGSAVDSANAKITGASVDTALAQAEADNKVALAKCEALAGDQQKTCRDTANAQLDLVKSRAKEIKAAQSN
jgi:hypothetical protein